MDIDERSCFGCPEIFGITDDGTVFCSLCNCRLGSDRNSDASSRVIPLAAASTPLKPQHVVVVDEDLQPQLDSLTFIEWQVAEILQQAGF